MRASIWWSSPDHRGGAEYSEELLALCKAVGKFHAVEATDSVLLALTNLQFGYPILLGDVLDQLQSPQMVSKLIRRLEEHKDWAAAKAEGFGERGPELHTRYYVMLGALISYQDVESVADIKSILNDPKNNGISVAILSKLIDRTKPDRAVQSPFVMKFHDYALLHVRDPWRRCSAEPQRRRSGAGGTNVDQPAGTGNPASGGPARSISLCPIGRGKRSCNVTTCRAFI